MAGVVKQPLIDPLTGQPSTADSGGSPALSTGASAGATAAGGSAPAAQGGQPAATPGGQATGTGYVNLSKVLGANIGAGTAVKSAADAKAASEASDRTASEGAYTGRLNNAIYNSSLGGGLLNGGAQGTPASVDSKLFSGGNGLTDSLKGLAFSDRFSRGKSQNMQELQGLGNSASAGRVLANNAGVAGGYTPKLSALDALIYGGNSDDATKSAISGAAANYNGEQATAEANTRKLNDKFDQARTAADTTATANRDFLTNMAPGYGKESKQGQVLADLLDDPSLAFGTPGPGLASMGLNQAPPTLTPVGTGAALAAPPKQQFGEGAQNTHDPAPGVDATLMRQRLNNIRTKQGR